MRMILDFSVYEVQQVLISIKEVVDEPWQQEIADFLEQWCDNRSFVEVKTSGSIPFHSVDRLEF